MRDCVFSGASGSIVQRRDVCTLNFTTFKNKYLGLCVRELPLAVFKCTNRATSLMTAILFTVPIGALWTLKVKAACPK